MKIRNILLTLLLAVAGSVSAQMMPPIPLDTAVRIGKLDNGLTYSGRGKSARSGSLP